MFNLKIIVFTILINVFSVLSFAKDISLEVFAKSNDVTTELNAEQLLTLNGYRQAVTSELIELKLNSDLFWSKLEQKKMKAIDEAAFLQTVFEKVSLSKSPTTQAAPQASNATATGDARLSGIFKAVLDLEKLKMIFLELTTDMGEAKLKSFYILANIDLDETMTWDDVGVQKAVSFTGVILDSWKKLIEKEIKGFERVVILEKDLKNKPDYLNNKSVILKWTSTFKKIASNSEKHMATYKLSAHYILQNAKSGSILLAFDFPIQKREFDTQNKKALSSALASLVYNLLFSEASKINGLAETDAKTVEPAEMEIRIISNGGLTEVYQINALLQDKFKDIKLTSQMKSYSSDGSSLIIRAEGSIEKILDGLSIDGGKIPLNEQKILLFNRADKTFAIIPKASNN